MADIIPKVAPLSPGAGTDVGTPEYAQYQEALNQSLKALENRSNPQTNLWNIAAGFLKPTRTGSFGESLGNVNEVMGKEKEREQQEALPIAQMRAQLAGQKYQMALESKSQQALAQAVSGMNQNDITQAMSSPMGAIGNPALMQRLAQAQMQAQPGTKAYEQIKTMLETQKNMITIGLEQGKLTDAQVRTFFETGMRAYPYAGGAPTGGAAPQRPAGAPAQTGALSIPEVAKQLMTDFGFKPEQLSLERTRAQQEDLIKREAAGEKNIFKPAPLVEGKEVYHEGAIDVPQSVPPSYMESRGYYRPDPKGDPVHWIPRPAAATGQATSAPAATATGFPLSPKAQQEAALKKEQLRAEADIAQEASFNKGLGEADVKTVGGMREANEAAQDIVRLADNQISLVQSRPTAFGYLNDPSLSSALLAAATEARAKGVELTPDRIAQYVKGVRDPKDLDAITLYANNAGQINLLFSRIDFKGQGAVSDSERRLVAIMGGLPSDSVDAIMLKADALKTRAQRDIDLHQAWSDYRAVHPNGSYDKFLRSDDYIRVKKTYTDRFDEMRDATSKLLKATSSNKPATAAPKKDSLEDRLNQIGGE